MTWAVIIATIKDGAAKVHRFMSRRHAVTRYAVLAVFVLGVSLATYFGGYLIEHGALDEKRQAEIEKARAKADSLRAVNLEIEEQILTLRDSLAESERRRRSLIGRISEPPPVYDGDLYDLADSVNAAYRRYRARFEGRP